MMHDKLRKYRKGNHRYIQTTKSQKLMPCDKIVELGLPKLTIEGPKVSKERIAFIIINLTNFKKKLISNGIRSFGGLVLLIHD